jgi:hypothetical protein
MTVVFDDNPLSSIQLSPNVVEGRGFLRAAEVFSVFCALAALTFLIRIPFRNVEGADDAFFLEIAHLWLRGALPYVHAFDIKPPGFFAILAAAEAVLGPNLQALKAVSIFFDAVAATGLYFIGCRMGSRAVGALAALLYPFLSLIVTNNSAYPPLEAFTILAFLAALSPLPPLKRAAAAGLAIGAAFTIKQTAAFEGAALLAILLYASDASRRWSVGLTFALTAAFAPLGFLIYFVAEGVGGILITDVVFNALQRPGSATEGVSFVDGVLRSLVYLARPVELLFILACLSLLRHRAIRVAAPNAAIGAIGVWAAAAILSVWAQHALFKSYLAPTLAPLMLLAGAFVAFGAPELKRVAISLRLAAVGLITVAIVLINEKIDLGAFPETRAFAVATQAIKATNPSPDDKLFVVSRGLWLHLTTDLPPPTPYFFAEHTLCSFPAAGPERLAEALATKPRYIVVSNPARSTCELPAAWRQVDEALAHSYRFVTRAPGDRDFFDLYELVQTGPRN